MYSFTYVTGNSPFVPSDCLRYHEKRRSLSCSSARLYTMHSPILRLLEDFRQKLSTQQSFSHNRLSAQGMPFLSPLDGSLGAEFRLCIIISRSVLLKGPPTFVYTPQETASCHRIVVSL
jgi:hypothetical protein